MSIFLISPTIELECPTANKTNTLTGDKFHAIVGAVPLQELPQDEKGTEEVSFTVSIFFVVLKFEQQ